MIAAIIISYSRGAFLGLFISILVLAWKIGRRNRLAIATLVIAFGLAFLALAPSSYMDRMATIRNPSQEASALSRRNVLFRSIRVAITNPLLGVGMGNFHIVSIKELVSHNAYTQVAADMGIPAMVVYILFIITPFKQLRRIERETSVSRRGSKYYYLAVGLQASLVGYMVSSFFGAVAYQYYIYYLVGYAICLRRIYRVDPNVTKDVAAAGIKDHALGADASDGAREEVAATSRATSASTPGWRDY
jgi:O-antigen ligase